MFNPITMSLTLASIAEFVENVLHGQGVQYIIQYGSSLNDSDYHDVDMFAICKKSPTKIADIGKIDLVKLSEEDLEFYKNHLSPSYCTEPFLTGRVIAGHKNKFLNKREEIMKKEPSSDIVNYLLQTSFRQLLRAIQHYQQNSLSKSLQSLTFAASHHLFAKWYEVGHKPVPLTELMSNPLTKEMSQESKLCRRSINRLKDSRRGTQELESSEINSYIEGVQRFFL